MGRFKRSIHHVVRHVGWIENLSESHMFIDVLAEEVGVEPTRHVSHLNGFEGRAPHRGRYSSGIITAKVESNMGVTGDLAHR